MHMLSSYRPVNGKTAFPNKRTHPITFQRRFQAKERVQLLSNGVSKQKNASNYFPTAFPNKRTRPITFQRRFQTKERVQLLSNGVFPSFIGSNPILPVRYGTIRRPTRAVGAACRIYFASAQEALPPCSDC